MATDINEQVSNMFNAAKQALNDDLKQNFYNAAATRTQAFRQLNNSANNRHAMFSGMPAATQMQYDQSTFLPGAASLAEKAIQKQQNNQDAWDEYMEYITNLQEQTDYYNSLASQNNSAASAYNSYSGN